MIDQGRRVVQASEVWIWVKVGIRVRGWRTGGLSTKNKDRALSDQSSLGVH